MYAQQGILLNNKLLSILCVKLNKKLEKVMKMIRPSLSGICLWGYYLREEVRAGRCLLVCSGHSSCSDYRQLSGAGTGYG